MENKLKVLIGDNTSNFGMICVETMSNNGMEVVLTPKDGNRLIDAVHSFNPDVIVMDSYMSGADAIDVLQTLSKENSKLPKTIVLSGHDNSFIENKVMELGASYYMLKPFEISTLCKRIVEISGYNSASKAEDESVDLETIVTEVILHIGVPAHIKGYHYIRHSIMLCISDKSMINSVTKELYPAVAKEFDTTSSRVERAIRHAIEIAWDRGDVDVLTSYFGYTINNGRGKPTNSEFIAMIADKLRLKLKKKVNDSNTRK